MDGHPTDGQLQAFAVNLLPAAESDRVEAHLVECEACCGRLDRLSAAALASMLEEMEPPAADAEPG